jgi:hypothetical protein
MTLADDANVFSIRAPLDRASEASVGLIAVVVPMWDGRVARPLR